MKKNKGGGPYDTILPPAGIDPYIAVSVANNCEYCVHSHTAAARAKGMTPQEHAELLQIIALAASTNHLATALQVPVDPEFQVD
jgi:AhpD family alkylhydroperoxidase